MKYRIPALEAPLDMLDPPRLHRFAETASNINWDGSMRNVALSSCARPQSTSASGCPKMNTLVTHVLVSNRLGESGNRWKQNHLASLVASDISDVFCKCEELDSLNFGPSAASLQKHLPTLLSAIPHTWSRAGRRPHTCTRRRPRSRRSLNGETWRNTIWEVLREYDLMYK